MAGKRTAGAIATTIVPWRDLRINRAKEKQMPANVGAL